MRRTFAKNVSAFADGVAQLLITARAYPELFQLCRNTDAKLYHTTLRDQFSSPTFEPLYEQLVVRLRAIAPLKVVTTNVDLCLEQRLGPIDVIERVDLERCSKSIQTNASFVAKLHGSISAIESVVFTTADYQTIILDAQYMAAVKAIFSQASVIFLGYGAQDDHILKLIAATESEHKLYGSGPHFLVTSSPAPPGNGIFRIGYRLTKHPDHRAALTVLDFVQQAKAAPITEVAQVPQKSETTKNISGFYISDFKPTGTHISGQALELSKTGSEAMRINAIIGLGFRQGELPTSETVAFHDLAVGLVCFDRVYLPLDVVGILHERATSPVFWLLVDSGALQFVDIVHAPVFASSPDSIMGDIGIFRNQDPRLTETRSPLNVIGKMLKPAAGKEVEGEAKIEALAAKVISFSLSEKLGLPTMVRDALLLPRVSQLLGFSEYVVPNTIPRWLAYPTIRLAHLVQTGLICDELHIRAARVPFGGTSLLSAAFSVKPAEQNVYDYASFVLTGAYGSNLSHYIENNPAVLLKILEFRESGEGEALRREIADRLETNDGTEFSAAIDGGLKKAIPIAVVQVAKDRFSTLLKTDDPSSSAAAVWGDVNTDDQSLWRWRDHSRDLLWIEAKAFGIKSDSLCMCGSGDRLKDCCLKALQ